MGATTVRQLTLDNSKYKEGRGDYLDDTRISSRQWEFEFLNVIFYTGFAQKVPVRWFDLWNVFNIGLYDFVFKLLRVDWVYEFRIFSSQIYVLFFKNSWRIYFFPLFIRGENRTI